MVEAGILEHEIPIAHFSVAARDRQDYVFGLLFEVAYAVARSAHPAALVAGEEETNSHAARAIKKWAEKSAAELEQLLEAL